jgi:hypothetical protein
MSELKRYGLCGNCSGHGYTDDWVSDSEQERFRCAACKGVGMREVQSGGTYLCTEVDALLAERDRREGELRAENVRLDGRMREIRDEANATIEALQSELAALRQQLREVTEIPEGCVPVVGNVTERQLAYAMSHGELHWTGTPYISKAYLGALQQALPPLPKEVE